MSTALIVLVGTLFGGAGLKFLELIWSRLQEGRLERRASEKRFELRAQELQDKQLEGLTETLKSVQAELDEAEKEIVRWREEYYAARESTIKQLSELQEALFRIRELELELARTESQQR